MTRFLVAAVLVIIFFTFGILWARTEYRACMEAHEAKTYCLMQALEG